MVVREREQVPARRLSEQRDEGALGQPRDFTDGADGALSQLLRRDRTDTPQALDRERVQERQLTVGRHHEETVGFRHTARDLREELRARDADRDREPDLLEHVASKRSRDLRGRAGHAPEATDIEEGLVDREPFHEWGRVLEHLEHGFARVGVRAHPGIDDDRVRTQLSRLAAVHRRAHAVGLRFVAGRQDHTRSDEHRPPTQARVVPLLHRRVEGVEVGVEDGGAPGHEHMFAHRGAMAAVPQAGGSPASAPRAGAGRVGP